jgi:hypothetical protein
MGNHESEVPMKEIDHYRSHIGEIVGKERDVVLATLWVQEMGPGNIGITHIEGF